MTLTLRIKYTCHVDCQEVLCSLQNKVLSYVVFEALVSTAENSSGSVSRSGLRSLLQDLSQVKKQNRTNYISQHAPAHPLSLCLMLVDVFRFLRRCRKKESLVLWSQQ